MLIALKDFPNLRTLKLGLHLDQPSLRLDAGPTLERLIAAYTLHGPVRKLLPHLNEITLHIDIEDAFPQSDGSDQFTIADEMRWHSFQEALLNIVKELSLPGIWIEWRSLNDYFLREEQAHDIISGIFKHLNDNDKILWRDKRDSQWPQLL